MQNYFLDGTKIEANANKYTFVWNKAVGNYDRKLDEKIKNHLREIDRIVAEENEIYLEDDLEETGVNSRITTGQVEGVVKSIDKKLAKNPMDKKLKKKAKEFKKDILPRKQKYEEVFAIFEGRNSYSKTDPDATFMRMKEDAMLNGQLKPAYNIQHGVDSEYITWIDISPRPTDTCTLIPFLKDMESHLGFKYSEIVADAGYESEENYLFIEGNGQTAYIKPQNYEISKTRKYKKDISRRENMEYHADRDSYICRNGRELTVTNERRSKTASGYVSVKTYYRSPDCTGCPYKTECIKGNNCKTPMEKRNKVLMVSKTMSQKRAEDLERITSEYGTMLRMNRSIQAEGSFADVKEDMNFRRYLYRGKANALAESILLAMGRNINKLHCKIQTGRMGSHLFSLKTA